MELALALISILVGLVLFVGAVWLAASIRRRLGIDRTRTAADERLIAEAHMYSQHHHHHF